MKKTVVKLSRPLVIDAGGYKTIYGFVAENSDNDAEKRKIQYRIDTYVSYLAAMHEWYNGGRKFSISKTNDWIDKDGTVHYMSCWKTDTWVQEICKEAVSKLGLSYTLYDIETYYWNDIADINEIRDGFITDEDLMDDIIDIADEKEYTVVLFNHPIWLQKKLLQWNEEGHCLIYGLTIDESCDFFDSDTLNYMGYMSMCEECQLKGKTSSGYTLGEDGLWYNGEGAYTSHDRKMLDASELSRERHDLMIERILWKTPERVLTGGVYDGFIISQDLYETLLNNSD